jgi:hypothetical protein
MTCTILSACVGAYGRKKGTVILPNFYLRKNQKINGNHKTIVIDMMAYCVYSSNM